MASVAQIRAAPWYPQVASVFAQAGVPEYLWESIIMSEDGGLDPSIAVADHYTKDGSFAGYSYGLFQINRDPGGKDPVYSANWAAKKLGPAIRNSPGASPDQLLSISEEVAWPGMAHPPDDAIRRANLHEALRELHFKYASGDASVNPQPQNVFQQIGSGIDAFNKGVDNAISTTNTIAKATANPQNIALYALTGLFALVLFGGGLFLLAQER